MKCWLGILPSILEIDRTFIKVFSILLLGFLLLCQAPLDN